MQAAYIAGHGGNEVVKVGDFPDPVRGADEVLIRLHAATVNRVDLYMRDSGAGITHRLPQVMGLDGAGTAIAIENNEKRICVGQRVIVHPLIFCGRCEFCVAGDQVLCTSASYLGEHRDGVFAEFVSVPARNVFPMPEGWNFVQSAALGVNFLTAWRMVFSKAEMKPWETALIFGIGGGVSLAALQLIKAMGGQVIVTSRDEAKLARAADLGADYGINGEREDVSRKVLEITDKRGVDVVIENVGEAVWSHALRSLVRGGRLVTCGATSGDQPGADLRRIFIRQLRILGSTLGTLGEFHDLLQFVDHHQIKPVIDSTYDLSDVHSALDRLESGRQFGKVAIDICGLP
ncbi:MAG: zinc-binding dehydrogenase [Mesorhizobium sp.]|uniref:zinc-binding dehydrogenase n=1 Tax=Mesorhizobium sp. TaxID=1871066 RepID=UPI001AC017ED|nr:zinc-binding dehydrogenase [Mesorhizobium sp.]MBN9217291.1 zinc-binding dehydrogenase [Mesorhizobium sp.]